MNISRWPKYKIRDPERRSAHGEFRQLRREEKLILVITWLSLNPSISVLRSVRQREIGQNGETCRGEGEVMTVAKIGVM